MNVFNNLKDDGVGTMADRLISQLRNELQTTSQHNREQVFVLATSSKPHIINPSIREYFEKAIHLFATFLT